MMRMTLGQRRWRGIKKALADELIAKESKNSEESKKKKKQQESPEYEMQNLVLQRMGAFKYYLQPWKREVFELQVKKIQKMELDISRMQAEEERLEEQDRRQQQGEAIVF